MKSLLLDGLLNGIDFKLLEPFRNKTVVVTGATGLIGSLVCKALLLANKSKSLNVNIIAVVRNKSKATSIFADYSPLNFILLDLYTAKVSDIIITADYILHAASITTSKLMIERPVDVLQTSINGTGIMLQLALRTHARMVYVSSMEFYGSLDVDVVADENALGYINLSSPRSCYPESKRFCECLCNSYAAQYGVHVCSARLAQTFGAGVLPGENRAFAQFARNAMKGTDIVLRTQGLSEGNYVNSVDCVAGLLLLLAGGQAGHAYNIANEESHRTIREVAQMATDLLGKGKSKVVVELDHGNSCGYAPDVHLRLSSAKIRKLGWSPKFSLSESFVHLGQYFREQSML